MERQLLWATIADLNGLLIAVEHGRSSWADFDTARYQLIEWLWEHDASALPNDVLDHLQRAAEHARNRKHAPARDSPLDAAAQFA